MKNPSDELIWQGRIHLGDEPGVYGDASYSGLCMELPVTFHAFDPTNPNEDIKLELEAEDVNVYSGYPGHLITIFGYEPDPTSGPYKWKQITLYSTTMTSNNTQVTLVSLKNHIFVSFQIRVDTTVKAGLYNDFVVVRLSLRSKTHYAVVGFQD
jgi:hypothetical protein